VVFLLFVNVFHHHHTMRFADLFGYGKLMVVWGFPYCLKKPLNSKMVKIDWKIMISLRWFKSVTHYVAVQDYTEYWNSMWERHFEPDFLTHGFIGHQPLDRPRWGEEGSGRCRVLGGVLFHGHTVVNFINIFMIWLFACKIFDNILNTLCHLLSLAVLLKFGNFQINLTDVTKNRVMYPFEVLTT